MMNLQEFYKIYGFIDPGMSVYSVFYNPPAIYYWNSHDLCLLRVKVLDMCYIALTHVICAQIVHSIRKSDIKCASILLAWRV